MTGKSPARTGITDWLPGRPDRPDQKLLRPKLAQQLALEETTIAEVLKANGYRTLMAGKWHVGENRPHWPLDRGFDLKGVIRHLRSLTSVPILTGLPFGHVPTKVCLPVGRKVTLSVQGRDAFMLW